MKKILIVDYDQSSLASLQAVLAGQGYQVVTAADGQTGWDKYNKESPDLVLMEAMLPKVHGFELCQRITSERNSQATVFIMTGVYKDRVYRTEALRTYGASEYFEKPLKMAELLASVQAALGRPEPKPAEWRPAAVPPAPPKPALEIRPEPEPAEPRKHEKVGSDDSIFTLPDDLDRLSREIPKVRKPSPAHHDPSPEPRLEALADELLKSVIVESRAPKAVQPKPGNGNGNGNGKADIDQVLASALAGLDLGKEKVKVPKTAPLPRPPVNVRPAPAPAPPAAFAPKPPVRPPVSEKPAPAVRFEPKPPLPQPTPDAPLSVPAPGGMKNTLTPGDPGSDLSPFFTPGRTKPEIPVERPRVQTTVIPPATQVPSPKPFLPAEKAEKAASSAEPVRHEPVRREPVRQEPLRPEPVRREPARHEAKDVQARTIVPGDIFQGLAEPREKKGFPKFVAVGLGVAALAAAAFVVLRPKPAPPVVPARQETPATMTPSNVPAQPIEEAPAPEIKPAPVKQKAAPKAKPANTEPAGAEAILPGSVSAPPPLLGAQTNPATASGQTGAATNQTQGDTQAIKAEETAPPQGTGAESGTATDPGASAAPTPIVPPVNEGDLVELSSVTEPPRISRSVDPVYPQTAQRLGVGGSITVNALIDEKGNVIDTGILKGVQDDKGLGRAAETAVKKWKFQPARKNGVAVKVWKSFIIVFKADANPAKPQ